MSDAKTTLAELKALVTTFVHERDWRQFHGAKNLSMSIVGEAAELMELFTWTQDANEAARIVHEKKMAVTEELADIAGAVLMFCDEFNIDLSTAIKEKMIKNAAKYPIEKSRGINKKYTEL
jgi:NTP pyrophosphatase (non-canonical NTP hydrolase)